VLHGWILRCQNEDAPASRRIVMLACYGWPASGRVAKPYALVGEEALKLARLEHLAHDVAAADEFALDVELRDRRPAGIVLDALAQLVRGEDVDALVVDAEIVEDLHD